MSADLSGLGGAMKTELSLAAASTAFLVIDMQNDFLASDAYCARRGLPVKSLRRTIRPILQLREALPPETRTVYTLQVYAADGSDDLSRVHAIRPSGLSRPKNEGPVRFGSWGAELIPELGMPAETVVKRRYDAFYQTDLEMRLRCWGIKTLIIGGVVSDICVETTARAAYIRDFDIVLATECVAGWKATDTKRTIAIINRQFGVSLNNDQIIRAFGAGSR